MRTTIRAGSSILAVLAGAAAGPATPVRALQSDAAAARQAAFQEELTQPRPIEALNSVWIEELTWMEVRDALAAGTTTAIIATGGIEQNGPYLATGKHNYVLRGACKVSPVSWATPSALPS